jgi:hypothetical protein
MEMDAKSHAIVSHNLVALVPGAKRADECFYFLAHWDHMGRDRKLTGDQIFNGAVDNATGVGALIEIARALQQLPQKPSRTIVLVATTAEERGLLGSEYLARHPVCPLKRTVAAVAIDALFPFGPDTHMTVTGFGSSELENLLAASAAKYGRKLQDDGQPEAGANYRADHYRFLRRGVPGFIAVGGPANDVSQTDPQAKALIDYITHITARATNMTQRLGTCGASKATHASCSTSQCALPTSRGFPIGTGTRRSGPCAINRSGRNDGVGLQQTLRGRRGRHPVGNTGRNFIGIGAGSNGSKPCSVKRRRNSASHNRSGPAGTRAGTDGLPALPVQSLYAHFRFRRPRREEAQHRL